MCTSLEEVGKKVMYLSGYGYSLAIVHLCVRSFVVCVHVFYIFASQAVWCVSFCDERSGFSELPCLARALLHARSARARVDPWES